MSNPTLRLPNHPDCPTACAEKLQQRVGRYGPFFYCTECGFSLPMDTRGDPAEPAGRCACGGLLFHRLDRRGRKFLSCWNYPRCAQPRPV